MPGTADAAEIRQPANPQYADLVLAGGGVKGIALVGATAALLDAGYHIRRLSGTSAGSLVGAIIAAGIHTGMLTGDEVKRLALKVDYRKFRDPGPVERIPILGPSLALLRGNGIYRGDYIHGWVAAELKAMGVNTFGDLRLDDDQLPPERRYRLVVTTADVTTGQLVRLPWDYRRIYGLDPDEQRVADAVRASLSIPFFFRPVALTSSTGVTSTLVDGGLLSNFPIDSLDRADGKPPRWPTFGVTVLPNLPAGDDKVIPALGPLHLCGSPPLLEAMIATMLVGRDQTYLNQPWVSARAIRVDTTDVGVLDFDITDAQTEELYARGYSAAQTFLSTWNWKAYLRRNR